MGIFETFFSRLQAELVKKDENDMVFWMDLKNTVFYVTYLYFVLELGISISFPTGIISNSWVHSKQVFYLLFFFFFCLGSQLWKVWMLNQLQREGWPVVNSCFFCRDEEESIDYNLFYCAKSKVFYWLLFSLFSVV